MSRKITTMNPQSNNTNEISVNIKGREQVVYAIPAKPKPREPWWKRNADLLLLIWACVMLIVYFWMNP